MPLTPSRVGVTRYYAGAAWLSAAAGLARGVLIEVDGDRFAAVTPGVAQPPHM